MKTSRPFIILASILLIVGLACSFSSQTPTQAPPDQPVQVINPTAVPPQPTEAPPTAVPPTEPAPATEPVPPAPQAQQFFTEEFDAPLSGDWSIFTVTGTDDADPEKVTVESEDGNLVWNFDSEYVYYYLFYNAFTYEDVKLEVRADNRGKNNNSVSLICRYDEEIGWYEFNIANNGLYDILHAEVLDSGKIQYNRVANGGSNAINQGKQVNEYSISCEGDDLTLEINGDEVISIPEKTYSLRSGQVGVSVSSFDVLPILIEMDWIRISEP